MIQFLKLVYAWVISYINIILFLNYIIYILLLNINSLPYYLNTAS